MALKYIGEGRYIMHIPAQDLNDEDVKQYATEQGLGMAQFEGLMIESGLYKLVETPKKAKPIIEEKMEGE